MASGPGWPARNPKGGSAGDVDETKGSAAGWLALVGPAGMPVAVRDRLADEVRKIIVLPDFQSWVIGSGGLAEPLTPEQSSAYVRAEAARWAEVIRAVGLKLD
jgi:tripartite-type tricarboxylate transporter receptor subunit TctC